MRNIQTKPDIEVEYKFRVKHKDVFVSLLRKKARNKKPREYQSNVMFDNRQGLMQTTNGRIRVRVLGESGNKTLTYKRPLQSKNDAKREIEYEIEFIDTTGQIEKILGAMEFTPSSSYERYRTEWQIDNVHITLDEYPYSDFVEIEGPQNKIKKIAKELGFNLRAGLTKPADTLFQEWRKERGLTFKPHMKFNDFDK